MKMRKSTWLLLVLALVAIFLVAGCTATTPTPPENGEEPPPTPPGDTAAPKVVKTMVSNVDGWGDGAFKITIVFDEDIYSSCAENLDNWTVRVVNSQRREGNRNILANDFRVEVVGNQIILYAWVVEEGTPVITYKLVNLPATWVGFNFAGSAGNLPAAIAAAEEIIDAAQNVVNTVSTLSVADLATFLLVHGPEYYNLLLALDNAKAAAPVLADPNATGQQITDALTALDALNAAYGPNGLGLQAVETVTTPTFAGLICSEDDAAAYKEVFGKEVTAADVVTWSLNDDCAISDILGNSQCGYSGQACCVGPSCEECEECDLTTGVCK